MAAIVSPERVARRRAFITNATGFVGLGSVCYGIGAAYGPPMAFIVGGVILLGLAVVGALR